MVTGVDFLPGEYWKRRASQRDQFYLLAIGGALILLLLGSIGHETRKTGLIRQQLRSVDNEYQSVLDQMADVQRLEERQAPLAFNARFYALLRAHPSLSRVLAASAASCPPRLTLNTISVRGIHIADAEQKKSRGGPAEPAVAASAAAARREQLDRFAKEREHTRFTLHIVGVAETDLDVVSFVDRLERSECVTDLTFNVSEDSSSRTSELRKFTIQCRLTKVL